MAEPADNLQADQAIPPAQAPQGAKIVTAYAERKVSAYAIIESEVESISMMNAQSNIYFSVGAFLAAAAISVYVNASFYDPKAVPPAAELLCKFGAPVCGVVAIVFVILGVMSINSRNSTWDRIKEESGAKE